MSACGGFRALVCVWAAAGGVALARPAIPPAAGRATGSVYILVKTPQTWAAADRLARAAGGRLATVPNAAVNERFFQAAKAAGIETMAPDGGGATYVWLGASDAAREGDWRWRDGKPVSGGYAAWGRGPMGREPDDYGGAQDCLALGLTGWPAGIPEGQGIGKAGEWNDVNGDNQLAWIAEFPATADANRDGKPDWQAFADAQQGIRIAD